MESKAFTIFSYLRSEGNAPHQLSLPLVVPQSELFPRKPQIVSVPGILPKERDRYRVVLGDRILGDRLDLDEALKLAKRRRR
jgi:hypothetical protein